MAAWLPLIVQVLEALAAGAAAFAAAHAAGADITSAVVGGVVAAAAKLAPRQVVSAGVKPAA